MQKTAHLENNLIHLEETMKLRILEAFFALSKDLFIIVDLNGKIQKVNPEFLISQGLTLGELIGLSIFELIHPDDVASFTQELAKIQKGPPSKNFELRARHKNGTYKNFRLANSFDSENQVIYSVFHDITEDKEREQEFKSLNEQLSLAQQAASIGSWEFEFETQRQTWSDEHYRIFEIEPNQDPAKLYELYRSRIHPQDLQKLDELLDSTLKKHEGFIYDHRVYLDNGKRVKYVRGIGKIKLSKNGTPISIYGTCQDRTSEVLTLKTLELERAKAIQTSKLHTLGEMSAGIAHEINNPLTIVAASLNILPRFISDPQKLREKITLMEKAVFRISKILNGLKKFSGQSSTHPKVDHTLEKIINESIVLVGAKLRSVDVSVTIDLKSHFIIHCNEIEIEQVFINLIGNAVDAIKLLDEKWINIRAFIEGDDTVVQVSDSGSGIPLNIQDKIFNPFYTTKMVGEGTGLGLSIVKGILDDHKASIKVLESSKNTCFELRFKTPPSQFMGNKAS